MPLVTHLQSIDEIVDLSHEALHEDHLRQANAQIPQLGRERLHLAEIVQLHCCKKNTFIQRTQLNNPREIPVEKSISILVKLGHLADNSCNTVCVISSMGSSM